VLCGYLRIALRISAFEISLQDFCFAKISQGLREAFKDFLDSLRLSYSIYISVSLSIIMDDSEGISIKRISPERGKYISPGQRPGYKIAVIFKP